LHIFADSDKEKQLISFNRGGSLFLNLRYYFEAWRTSCVFALP
jgi:hypothetical protein